MKPSLLKESLPPTGEDEFVAELTRNQFALKAFIRSLLTDKSISDDILQETNLVLWKKRSDFAPGTNFKSWAFRVAYFQTLALLKKDRSKPWQQADEELLERLASESAEIAEQYDERRAALTHCLGKLNEKERSLITARYETEQTIIDLSKRLCRPVGSIRVSLCRIRSSLRECIKIHLPQFF